MNATISGILRAGFALALSTQVTVAGETYVSLGLGAASDGINASTTGVNHATRCDSLLYANPANAPTGGACMDNTPRRFFGDSFDLGAAFSGAVSLGYAWERFRVEAEFFSRSHNGETRPGNADADNPALQGKASEWSSDSPPYHRVADFRARQLLVNLYYTFGEGSGVTPYVGLGAGFAQVKSGYVGSYLRRTVADGYITAAGGDPAQPEEWQLAAAGSQSLLDTEVSGEAFGYQVVAGLERKLADRTYAFLSLRWADFNDISSSGTWSTIRSHAPVQADGVTPFTSVQAFEDIGGLAVTVGVRYAF